VTARRDVLVPAPRGGAAPWRAGRADDTHEREAERVAADADRLVSGPDPVRRFGARFGHDFSTADPKKLSMEEAVRRFEAQPRVLAIWPTTRTRAVAV
jgi:hypothetical protein